MAHKLLFGEYEEHLDHRGWRGARVWECPWDERWKKPTPKLGEDWPVATELGRAYMKCILVEFLPVGKTLGALNPEPETCHVVASYSSRELEENVITFRGKVDVLEVGMGDTFTPISGPSSKFHFKVAKIFPYTEMRVTKTFDADHGPEIINGALKNATAKVNASEFRIASEMIAFPTTDQQWVYAAGQVLFISIDMDTWEIQNNADSDYANLEPRYRATFVFGVRVGHKVSGTTLGWNHIYRPRLVDKTAGNHTVMGDAASGNTQEPQYDTDAGLWGTLTPPLYQTADFGKMFTGDW